MMFTAQKMKFSTADFLSFLRIWLHLPKKFVIENFIFFCSDIQEELVWLHLPKKFVIENFIFFCSDIQEEF